MRRAIILLGICLAATLAVVLLLRPADDGLSAYPHAFLAEAGYDPELITYVAGPIDAPPTPPDGLLPAWQCDDPAFADTQRRPWLFPMASGAAAPPVHPTLKRQPPAKQCHRYRSPEAEAMLDTYKRKNQP